MSEVFDGDQFSDELEEGPITYTYDYELTRNNQTITLSVDVDYYPAFQGNDSYVDILSTIWGDYEFILSPEEETDIANDIVNQIDEDSEKEVAQTP